MQNIGTKNTEG